MLIILTSPKPKFRQSQITPDANIEIQTIGVHRDRCDFGDDVSKFGLQNQCGQTFLQCSLLHAQFHLVYLQDTIAVLKGLGSRSNAIRYAQNRGMYHRLI